MANYPKYTSTSKTPAATYENLVQYNVESTPLVSGDGNDNDLSQLNITMSYAVSVSYVPTIGLTTIAHLTDNITMNFVNRLLQSIS